MAVNLATPPVYDCFVLSGGGAKGAYGAGAAKAVEAYRELRKLTNPVLYVGASAGALNAYILASQNADALIAFWRDVDNRRILGSANRHPRLRAASRWLLSLAQPKKPFSIFGNKALRALVQQNAQLGKLHSPLIVAVTDYTLGAPRAFYRSELIDHFIAADQQALPRQQRLRHLKRIDTDEVLVDALVASAAIPVIFPPVRIQTGTAAQPETGWFIDGGVGNNTPTREAAYFNRFLGQTKRGVARVAYCVKLDTPQVLTQGNEDLDLVSLLTRTMDVYSAVHMKPIVDGWNRINREVEDQNKKVDELLDWLKSQIMDGDLRDRIGLRIGDEFGKLGGAIARVNVPLIEIEPSAPLGDVLKFDPANAEKLIEHGYKDALKVLRNRQAPDGKPGETMIDEGEYSILLGTQILPARR